MPLELPAKAGSSRILQSVSLRLPAPLKGSPWVPQTRSVGVGAHCICARVGTGETAAALGRIYNPPLQSAVGLRADVGIRPYEVAGGGSAGRTLLPARKPPLGAQGEVAHDRAPEGIRAAGHCQLTTPQSGLRPASSPSQGSLGTVRHGATSWHVGAKNDLPFPGGRSC